MNIVKSLIAERKRLAQQIANLSTAIAALSDKRPTWRKRHLSRAARRRIAQAQKKRWAALRAKQKKAR